MEVVRGRAGACSCSNRPGQSFACRPLVSAALPRGSYQHLDVSWDGRGILFSYCPWKQRPRTARSTWNGTTTCTNSRWSRSQVFRRRTDLIPCPHPNLSPTKPTMQAWCPSMPAGGRGNRNCPTGCGASDGPYDDFAPRYLPSGKIVFISTRRRASIAAGAGRARSIRWPCARPTAASRAAISYHETHEWDPAVLDDGRVIYTRWDYVDRDAVHYQQLWTVRPDGSDVRIFYGNNTLNPVGVWEARPVPGSRRVMATAAAHHAMTAGSIILAGRDPRDRRPGAHHAADARRPVSRERGAGAAGWHAPAGVPVPPPVPAGSSALAGPLLPQPLSALGEVFPGRLQLRWPDRRAECQPANMFGMYLVDACGNKELLYRDLEICSLWPMPLRPRGRKPPDDCPLRQSWPGRAAGRHVLAAERLPGLAAAAARRRSQRLRVVQVLPKTTPHANDPTVGLANASPGRQVLGHRAGRGRRLGVVPRPGRHRPGVPGPGRARAGGADDAEPHLPAAGRERQCASAATSRARRAAPGPAARGPARPALGDPARPRRLEAVQLSAPGAAGARSEMRLLPQPREARREASS